MTRRLSFSKMPDLVAPSSPEDWAARQLARLPRSGHGLDPQPLASATAKLTAAVEEFESDLLAAYGHFMPMAPAAVVRAVAGSEYEWACTLAGDMRLAARAEVLSTVLPGRENQLQRTLRSIELSDFARNARFFVSDWGVDLATTVLRKREDIL